VEPHAFGWFSSDRRDEPLNLSVILAVDSLSLSDTRPPTVLQFRISDFGFRISAHLSLDMNGKRPTILLHRASSINTAS